jgi:hypothetical protein
MSRMQIVCRRAMIVPAIALTSILSGGASGASPPMPLLVQEPYLSIDRDLPPAVRDRKVNVVKELNERAKAAARLPATAANGCVPSSFGSLGSPAPSISSRLLGHHVEVVFNFTRMPTSLACRPFELAVVVFAGKKASSSFKNSVGRFWLQGPRGRAVVDLPWSGNPPYRVNVSSATITGRRGPQVERSLPCPGTHSVVRGCLPGYRPTAHTNPMPKPVLPVRGLDLSSLEATLRYAISGQRTPPIVDSVPQASSCASLKVCTVTYVDPAFPGSPYRVRYRIAGQQVRGCWLGWREGAIDPLPFPDATIGQSDLAACSSWLR